jgi:group I intron endonuclease
MYPVYLVTSFHPSYGQYIWPYVGCIITEGKTIDERFAEHCHPTRSSGATYLQNAIRKHGKKWFQVEEIDRGNTPDQAKDLEKWWVMRLGAMAPDGGYNLTKGGDGIPGYKHTAAVKQAQSARQLGKRPSEETKARMSQTHRAAFADPEYKERHRQSLLGHSVSDEGKAKMSAWQKGIPKGPNPKLKIARVKQIITPEHKAAISAGMKGKMPKNFATFQGTGADALRGKPWSAARRAAQERNKS